MDFLIGGLPRGGTTIAADLFNFHPSAYCLSHESQIAPLCMSLALRAPVAKRHLAATRQEIRRWIDFAMRDLAGHLVSAEKTADAATAKALGIEPLTRQRIVFDERRVGRLADEIGALLTQGLFGEQLVRSALDVLDAEIAKDTPDMFRGEKSPANVFAFSEFGTLGAKLAVVMKREPFAFVRSMRNFNMGIERFDAPFRKTLWEMLGMYLDYAEATASLKTSRSLMVVDYDELINTPQELVSKLFNRAKLPKRKKAVELAAAYVQPQTKGRSWSNFSAAERAVIWHVTEGARALLGYDDSYFAAREFTKEPSARWFRVKSNSIHSMSGFVDFDRSNLWLQDRARLALCTTPETHKVTLPFWVNLPPSVLARGEIATLDFYGGVPERLIERIRIVVGPKDFEVTLYLSDIPPLLKNSNGELRVISLRPSHSFCPISLPDSDAAAGFDSPDYLPRFGVMRPPVFG